jgi:hypothetical protein
VKKFNNKNQKPCVPWWDQNCTKLVRQRNKARNRASHTGRGEDFKNYKEKEKLCKKMLHDTQQTYWENYCNSLNNNSNLSQIWYNVKQMLGFYLLFMYFKLTTVIVSTTDFAEIFSK